MRLVIQRVKSASVTVADEIVGKIAQGVLVLAAVGRSDNPQSVQKAARKTASLRIFPDEQEKMNVSLRDFGGEVLVVSQFTLFGDTSKGNRPSFIDSADPTVAIDLLDEFCNCLETEGIKIQRGRFGAMMDVALVNWGPVTLIIDT